MCSTAVRQPLPTPGVELKMAGFKCKFQLKVGRICLCPTARIQDKLLRLIRSGPESESLIFRSISKDLIDSIETPLKSVWEKLTLTTTTTPSTSPTTIKATTTTTTTLMTTTTTRRFIFKFAYRHGTVISITGILWRHQRL